MKARALLFALAAAAPASGAFAQSADAPKPAPAQRSPAQAPAEKKPDKTLDEVVVTADRPQVQTSIDRRSYSVTADLQTQAGSIADALRNVPAVQVDVQGNLTLRGDAGVTIMIDGKPSTLFQGENRGQALLNLPAERIERVEVITNPSVEFRSDGSGGIINLVTKQQRGAGTTGSLRANVITGGRFNTGMNIGHNSNKLTVAGDLNYRHEKQTQTTFDERSRRDVAAGGFIDSRQESTLDATIDFLSGRLGADYDISKKTRISGELRLQYQDFDGAYADSTERDSIGGALAQALTRSSRIDQTRSFGGLSATMRRRMGEGHELTLSAEWEENSFAIDRFAVTDFSLPDLLPSLERMLVRNEMRHGELKGDYVRPFKSGAKLKLGFDVDFNDIDYDNTGYRAATPGPFVPEASLTNLFLYEQQLSQAYASWEQPFGDFTVLAGVRAEDVRQDLNSVTQARQAENDYFRLYPSLHLGWKVSDNQTLKASYSRRVNRPSPDLLNPYRFIVDATTYRAGNPDLKPQQTHSFELGWEYRKQPTVYLATLYYRENEDGLTQIFRDLGDGTFLYTWDNVSKSRAAGIELTMSGRLTKKITYNLSGNAFWTELDAASIGFTEKRSGTVLFGRANVNWQVTPKDFVQINGFLNGKRITPQGYADPAGMLNLGWRHKLNDRLSFLVTAQDALKTFKDEQRLDTPDLKAHVRRRVDSRVLMVGLAWSFGGGRPRDPGFEFQGGGVAPQ